MEETVILDVIKLENGKITFKDLLRKFNFGRQELYNLILKLKVEGKVLQVGNKYRLFPEDLHVGNVIVSSSLKKYIVFNGEKILLSPNGMNNTLLNDIVAFRIDENNEAEVVSIVDRSMGKMTCEVKLVNDKLELIPFHDDITVKLDQDIMDQFSDGDIILVDIKEDETKFIKIIGRRDDPSIDDTAIALNFGFDNNYDEEDIKEINSYPTSVSEEEIKDRVDYRNQECFTIDGADTKDMDDGVYAEVIDNNIIRVYVHIADVSHYIKPGSRMFKRACDKTTSLYTNNYVFHMLHHVISNGICSLNQGLDRLTKTVVIDIDKDGNIVGYDIQKSVINSKKKMVYEDVDELIMRDNCPPGYEKYQKTLYTLYDAAVRLEKKFVEDYGKLNFANTELSITYNDDGSIKRVANPENSISRKIIENLMIAANACVATWFISMDMPTVFRIHEFPNIAKINHVIFTLNQNGYNIEPIDEVDTSKSLQKIIEKLSKYPEFPIISQMLVMTMQRARYSIENLGHFALGLDAYLHFTSPIRRLADLMVHMMVDLIFENSYKLSPWYLHEVEYKLSELAKRASYMEWQAKMAEQIAENRQILKHLAKNSDELHEATVVDIGKQIRLRVEGIDTFIKARSLDKVLSFDAKRKRYFDKTSNHHLKIGSKLLVKVTNVSCVNDKFNVSVYGFADENVKKRVLKK